MSHIFWLAAETIFLQFKGITQRDVRGVESWLKRSVLINCLVVLVNFFKLKDTPAREVKIGFSVLTIIELNLPVEFTIPANDGPAS
jgi:hypothetical protein